MKGPRLNPQHCKHNQMSPCKKKSWMAEMGTREAVSLELDLLMRSSQASNLLASVSLIQFRP